MKDVLIAINSIHNYGQGDEEDSIEFTTDGHYLLEDDTACLSYLETEVTGMQGTRTSVFVSDSGIVVDRDGLVKSRMVFCPGEKTSFLYDTPNGAATMTLNTRRMSHSFDESGGSLEIEYVLDVEHVVLSRNRFNMKVTEQKKIGDRAYV